MNVFEAVKQSVTTRQAAEYYGIHVGRNGMACCPFHNDKTPSMKLDRRYHCFGVMVVTVVQIGVLTPPVGLNAYVVSGMMRDVPLQKVFRGCVPFVGVLMVGAAILTIFPQIALWLPNLMLGD